MYHYILLFINKVLYYIRTLFTHWKSFLWFCDCDCVIGNKSLPYSLPRPLRTNGHWPKGSKGGEEPHPASPKREGSASPSPSERRGCASSQVFCRKLSDKEPCPYPSCAHRHSPPFGGVGGGCRSFSIFTYLSVKQIVTKVFAELVTPVPRKTIAFWIKLLTFANRKRKAPPDLPEPTVTDRREVMERGVNSEISPKMFRS